MTDIHDDTQAYPHHIRQHLDNIRNKAAAGKLLADFRESVLEAVRFLHQQRGESYQRAVRTLLAETGYKTSVGSFHRLQRQAEGIQPKDYRQKAAARSAASHPVPAYKPHRPSRKALTPPPLQAEGVCAKRKETGLWVLDPEAMEEFYELS